MKNCMDLIKVEKLRNRNVIPILFICSDCGANISAKHLDLIAQVENDYITIVNELKEWQKKLAKLKIQTVVLEPKKSYATQALGVHTYSADKIKKNFRKHAKAEVYQFDRYNPDSLILELKKIL